MQFLQPLQVSILSERRARSPYGLNGGGDGAKGLNLWLKGNNNYNKKKAAQANGGHDADEKEKVRTINVGGKGTMQFGTGDWLILHTPGGGGYGRPDDGEDEGKVQEERLHKLAHEWEARGTWADKAKVDF